MGCTLRNPTARPFFVMPAQPAQAPLCARRASARPHGGVQETLHLQGHKGHQARAILVVFVLVSSRGWRRWAGRPVVSTVLWIGLGLDCDLTFAQLAPVPRRGAPRARHEGNPDAQSRRVRGDCSLPCCLLPRRTTVQFLRFPGLTPPPSPLLPRTMLLPGAACSRFGIFFTLHATTSITHADVSAAALGKLWEAEEKG